LAADHGLQTRRTRKRIRYDTPPLSNSCQPEGDGDSAKWSNGGVGVTLTFPPLSSMTE
jgi:hypothetical protein